VLLCQTFASWDDSSQLTYRFRPAHSQ
jgi:hypothetical protein